MLIQIDATIVAEELAKQDVKNQYPNAFISGFNEETSAYYIQRVDYYFETLTNHAL